MSRHETPMTRWYWQQVGGTLIEEFVAVEGTSQCGRRVLDGLVVLDGELRIAPQSEVSLAGKDVIVIQTKASRLGMYLMGQASFQPSESSDSIPVQWCLWPSAAKMMPCFGRCLSSIPT